MLPVDRPPLPADVQRRLDEAEERRRTGLGCRWEVFRSAEVRQATNIVEILRRTFHGKCAYCEENSGSHVDHLIPKSVQPEGTYRWENLLPACPHCNQEYKGSSLEWSRNRKHMLLDPCIDEPLRFFDFLENNQQMGAAGTVVPALKADPEDQQRAAYTILRLKLNIRDDCNGDDIVHKRGAKLELFRCLLAAIERWGPDSKCPGATKTNKEILLEMMDPKRNYLAILRQYLRKTPQGSQIRARLVQHVPEVEHVLRQWDIPPRVTL